MKNNLGALVKNNIRRLSTERSLSIPKGFKASGIHCGIKKIAKNDISLIVTEKPGVGAGVFTKNKFCAAPVVLCKEVLKDNCDNIHALIVNSGCANAVTGDEGLKNAWEMAKLCDNSIANNKNSNSTLVMSTGVIGHQLPMDKIKAGISKAFKELGEGEDKWKACSEGFMTTDTWAKMTSTKNKVGEVEYKMLGIAKGAGMIHPNMATLLSTVITDLRVSSDCLSAALKYAADRSFNSISIDGDTSTNDTCIVLANGEAGNKVITDINSQEFIKFRDSLTNIMIDLAKMIVQDGEGATKFITVNVKGAPTYETAKIVANSISTSALVKTAFYGEDANWGRIICAVGYCGVEQINPEKVSLSLKSEDSSLLLLDKGQPIFMDEEIAKTFMVKKEINLEIDLGIGNESATMWTCDFSHEYVTINGSYRS